MWKIQLAEHSETGRYDVFWRQNNGKALPVWSWEADDVSLNEAVAAIVADMQEWGAFEYKITAAE